MRRPYRDVASPLRRAAKADHHEAADGHHRDATQNSAPRASDRPIGSEVPRNRDEHRQRAGAHENDAGPSIGMARKWLAIDYVYAEWNNKACAFVSYGVRTVEALRGGVGELQMADVRAQVRIALPGDFPDHAFTPTHETDASTMFDRLEAWATAMRTLRSRPEYLHCQELRRRSHPASSDAGSIGRSSHLL